MHVFLTRKFLLFVTLKHGKGSDVSLFLSSAATQGEKKRKEKSLGLSIDHKIIIDQYSSVFYVQGTR